MKPEEKAHVRIDELLTAAGWDVQKDRVPNLAAGRGVAIYETNMTTGVADYLLVVDQKVIGVVEAKPAGHTLSGVLRQARDYSQGTRADMKLWLPQRPLPFNDLSTGYETYVYNHLDPRPRSRRVYAFHRPQTLAGWAQASLDGAGTLHGRLQAMPTASPLVEKKRCGSRRLRPSKMWNNHWPTISRGR